MSDAANESTQVPIQTEGENKRVKYRPVSGRKWKQPYSKATQFADTKIVKKTWEQKQAERNHMKAVKALEKEMKDRIQDEKDEAKKRREENLKRREENERKAEVYQVIKNPKKLKKMSKKQLQQLQKR